MPHVKYLVHFLVVSLRRLLDDVENNRWLKQVVFYNSERCWQVFHTLGLSAATTVYETADVFEMLEKQLLHHGGISPGGA